MPDQPAPLAVEDFDAATPAPPPPADLPAVADVEIPRETYVRTLTITDGKKRHKVAANAVANRAQGQIIYAKMVKMLERKLDDFIDADAPPDILTLSRLAATAETIQSLGEMVYGPGKTPKAGEDLEQLAVSMIRAATEGAAKGAGEDKFEARRKRMAALGKPKQVEEVVEIAPKAP